MRTDYIKLGLTKVNDRAPYNGFWAFGPNISHYPGAFPCGFLNKLKRTPWWGEARLHLCSGTIKDGITIDINPDTKPTIIADLNLGVPLKDNSFDFVLMDPPYSKDKAENLYQTSLLSVPKLLSEAGRVVKPAGYVLLLDLRTWPPPSTLRWEALIAIYIANRGPKPLRALSVFRGVRKAERMF